MVAQGCAGTNRPGDPIASRESPHVSLTREFRQGRVPATAGSSGLLPRHMVQIGDPRAERLVRGLAWGLVFVSLLNGAPSYLKRVGLLERARYEAFWSVHCSDEGTTSAPFGLGRRCAEMRDASLSVYEVSAKQEPYRRHLFEVPAHEVWVKLVKDAYIALAIGLSLLLALRARSPVRGPASGLLFGLAAAAAVSAIAPLWRGQGVEALAGLRSFGFLAVALVGGALVAGRRARVWATALTALLALEALLVTAELLWGLPIHHQIALMLPKRPAGTFVRPNALGIVALCSLGFVASLGSALAVRVSWVAASALVVASGSGTGWIALPVLALYVAFRGRMMRWALPAGASILAIIVVLLPRVVARHDVYDSILGRAAEFREALRAPPLELGFGHGLGTGTNASFTASRMGRGDRSPLSAESMPTHLLRQTGLVGLGLFLLAFVRAWVRSTELRPLLLALLLAFLTSKLPEVFPANVLLGLALARPSPPPASVDPST